MGKGLSLADTAFLKNAGFNPASLTGLYRWYKADQYLGIANNGDSVGGGGNTRGPWLDYSGNGDDATAAFGPIYTTNRFGTMPALEFDFSHPAMLITPSLAADFTVVCVCQTPASGADSFIFYNTATGHQLRTQFFASHDVLFYNGGATPFANFSGHNIEVVGCKRTAGNVTFRQNTSLFAGGVAAGAWTLNQIGNGSIGATITIAEIIVYNTSISESDLDKLYNLYLKPKYPVLP